MDAGKDILFTDWDLETIIRNLSPSQEDEVGQIAALLQADKFDDALVWLRIETNRYSWVMLAAAYVSLRQNLIEEARRWLRAITLIATDTVVQLWAWNNLRKLGKEPPPDIAQKVMGIIIEVPNEGGEDVLASYADGTARFLSFAGAMIIWEDYHDLITPLIHEGLKMAHPYGNPVKQHTTNLVSDGEVRLTILTPGGLYIWEGIPEEGSDISRLFARQAVLLKTLIQFALENRSG
jgi:hypothetical protein